ncbi:hypothetical protein KQI84_12700 [bacterium]|nr:hypothetical protein [bacterium]
MRHQTRIVRLAILLLALALTVTACKGTRTNVAIKKTQEMLAEIENLRGAEHNPEKVEEIRSLINQANSQLAAEQTGQAFVLAKQAQTTADQTLIDVRSAEARALWTEAEEEIRVADINSGNRIDPDRYQRILDLRSEAEEARANNDFTQTIQLAREIKGEVATLLSELKTEAERQRIQAEQKLLELKSVGGGTYAPETVINVQDVIARAEKTMGEDRDYVLAANQFIEAAREAERGIEQVLREQSEEMIDEIENLLASALSEGAREFVPEQYNTVVNLHEVMIGDFNENRYNKVKLQAKELKPMAQNLVLTTKRKAADSRIETIQREIKALVEGGAREYLPGRVEVLEDFLNEAQQIRSGAESASQTEAEAAFDQIKEIANRAAEEADKINRQFEDLATEAIRLAGNRLDTTESVYTQVQEIFEPMAEVPEDMIPFESGKEARRVQLGQELEAARENLIVADNRQREQKYRGAILLAEEQSRVADRILGEVYHLVANNAVIELSNMISRYERDGAREYASEELQRSNRDLARVKDAINKGDYLPATELAAAARANIELMAQRISGRAVEDIRGAREAAERAMSDKTRKYAAELLVQVNELIQNAEVELQNGRLKLAVETANQAIEMARQAEVKANRMAAEDALAAARERIERAQKAGAALYAGRDMENSKKLIDSARGLYDNGDYEKAESQALSSAERAEQALYKKINDAEAAIADAKAVGGWEYDNQTLARASANVRISRDKIDQGYYTDSARLADSAETTATAVAKSAKRSNFREAVSRMRENLMEGQQQGINYFQVQDSVEVRRRLAALENEFSVDRYDYVMAEMAKLEGKLRQTLDHTDDLVDKVAEQQTARLNFLVQEGAADYAADLISDARGNLKYAQLDFNKGLYKSAHSSLESAIKQIDEIESRYNQEHYSDSILGIFEAYGRAQHQFSNVLSLGPNEMKALAFGSFSRGNVVAIAGSYTPSDFRAAVEQLYSIVLQMEYPADMEAAHKEVITALNEGRIAAIHFEKLVILNEASNDEGARLIDQAYARINSSNQIIAELKRQFFSDEVRFRLVQSGVTLSDIQ